MGWKFPWASSFNSDFNNDFSVSITEKRQREVGVEYNYRREAVFEWRAGQEGGGEGAEAKFAAMCGTDAATYHRDRPGMSAFALEDGVVYHTYSTYARGVDGIWGMYQWLDRAPKGRNETGVWWRRHDEYDTRRAMSWRSCVTGIRKHTFNTGSGGMECSPWYLTVAGSWLPLRIARGKPPSPIGAMNCCNAQTGPRPNIAGGMVRADVLARAHCWFCCRSVRCALRRI